MATTLTIAGSGFTPNGTASVTITALPGQTPSVYTATATSTGAVSFSISLATITNINTATSLSLYATDTATGAESNTVNIPLSITVVNPQLSYSGGTISYTAVE